MNEQVPALRLIGLHKSFGDSLAVDYVDLIVPSGSSFGLVGPNGAGKTTALSMAVGLLRPDAGGQARRDERRVNMTSCLMAQPALGPAASCLAAARLASHDTATQQVRLLCRWRGEPG